mmetsp:Transcript_33997/g.63508  ORF Transcript_33997/g.63508 Transcript_33997/m.63508 type:complete len:116 (+) Transcript_33997:60-407(+)
MPTNGLISTPEDALLLMKTRMEWKSLVVGNCTPLIHHLLKLKPVEEVEDKALVDNGVIKNDRLWTLANSVPWIGGVVTFYNRECYDNICKSMESKRVFLVKGTPGIGKTMFLQRV